MLLDAGAQHQYCLLLFDKLCLQPLVGTGRVLQFGLVLMEFLLEVLDVLFEVGDYGAAGGTGHFGGAQVGVFAMLHVVGFLILILTSAFNFFFISCDT